MSDRSLDVKTELDRAKKIYRAAVDAVRKLDEGLKKKKAYREVFHQDTVGLRYKLREYCERLLFYNPLYYGRKAEEVLWRKVFYDIIQLIKKNRRHVRPGSSLETAYRTHLSSACGYYHHLMFRLQRDFNLNLENKVDLCLLPDNNPGRYSKSPRRKELTPSSRDWALKAVHRCLVSLGDIARYQQEFDSGMSMSVAERYYQQAVMMFPEIGMPHNQLGTLASSRYFHCEAAYHYIRCMACESPFEGAEGNLQRLFEKNQKRYQDMKQLDANKQPSDPEEQCYHDLKGFFVRFLNLLRIFFDVKQGDSQEIQECCQSTLHSFNHCMFYEPVYYCDDLTEETLHYMEDDIVFKIVVICMATIYILQKRGSKKVTATTAFLLALFSHILNHVVIRLQGALYEKENPNKILQSTSHPYEACYDDSESDKNSLADNVLRNEHMQRQSMLESDTQMNNLAEDSQLKEPKKKSKSKHPNIRRRRARKSVASEESDLSDLSDLSEGDDQLHDQFMSDESEEEPVGFYEDSDSDMSDSLMKSQELEPGFTANHETDSDNTINMISAAADLKKPIFHGTEQMWSSDLARNDSLAHFSLELFSTSVPFLGANFKLSQSDVIDDAVVQGTKLVTVPPGFSCSSEAKHVAEISQKLANFVIETDTEASLTTEAEFSTDTDHDDSSEDNDKVSTSEEEKELVHQQNVIEVIQGEGLMSVVKVMCDWMKCNASVIKTCAQSSQSVWCRLSVLLNFLPHESVYIHHDECWLDELSNVLQDAKSPDWMQQLSLQEDIHLKKFPPLQQVYQALNKKTTTRLTEIQESFLRTCCLRQFGYFLSGLEGLQFSYHDDKGIFIGPAQPTAEDEVQQEVAMEKMVDTESRRNQLMRDMAQLRLQAEVSQLEGSLSTSDTMPFPPYLIPNTSSLCAALPLLRKLNQCNRSIIVIPLAVIDTLDFQKKESQGAREAIRWLEAEFRKGNRYIRAQKNSEKLSSAVPRHMKKKNRDTWCALEILNCALYLSRQGGDFGQETVVSILTTNNFHSIHHPLVTQALSSSEQEGVSVENVSVFVNKWSELLNKG